MFPSTVVSVFYILKIYNILWLYFQFMETLRIIVSTIISTAILGILQMALFGFLFPISIYLISLFLVNTLIISQRMVFKKFAVQHNDSLKSKSFKDNENVPSGNIMLIGAGSAGEMIIREFARNWKYRDSKIKCVIDDDIYKHGQYISGIRVIGGRDIIVEAAKRFEITTIVFAIPSCPNDEKAEILNICQKTDCDVRVIPSVYKMYDVSELAPSIRKVQIEDLLGRDPIDLTLGDRLDYVSDKIVLVTGGGGTIGSELCRQIASHNPSRLIIFDVYENSAYEIQNELKRTYPNLDLVTLIGSVRDSKRLDYLFKTYKPQIVYHAAAHKHVPLMEDSPNETIKNNVFGTFKTAHCASKYNVEKFVLISTDKAVNPTNIMGASKRICEMIIQTCNKHSNTEFVAVRFGNVLGSNGSVIPLFKKQIEEGGPVTVTDPNIIRYFMTIPEAVSLVLQAGKNAVGGEIFVLDMGKPVKILTLAENLIKLSGFTPYKDIAIEFTGLRPGEKLFEELLMSEEGLTATENNLIYIGKPIEFDEEEFINTLDELKDVMYDESADIRALVKKIVPTYKEN
ncbi:MAG: polysaccharide biosynthesis protein, partial [Clostridia bacterium]|nr:polysaccharide biosynthesis protein [Clostridia bacterium]